VLFSVAQTANGWTDNVVGAAFFREALIPQMREKTPDKATPILLTYDGHDSHDTDEWIQLGIDFNIRLFKLPAKTSNKTQPLDVCGFGPIKKKWLERAEEIVQQTGAKVHREDFIHEFMGARARALTSAVVKKGFRDSGIWPLNPAVFPTQDYAPARLHSTIGHVPSTYPAQHISAGPLAIADSSSVSSPDALTQRALRVAGRGGMAVNNVDDEGWGTEDEAESSDDGTVASGEEESRSEGRIDLFAGNDEAETAEGFPDNDGGANDDEEWLPVKVSYTDLVNMMQTHYYH
jgi:hypothetical protein